MWDYFLLHAYTRTYAMEEKQKKSENTTKNAYAFIKDQI